MNTQIPEPSSHQAERELIASVLMDQERAKVLTRQVTPIDFYNSRHKEIFSAIKVLVDRGDEVTTAGVLEVLNNKLLPSDLAEIFKEYLPSNDRGNIKLLKDNTYLRQVMKIARLIYERAAAKDYQDIETFAGEIEASILSIKPGAIADINTLIESSTKRMEIFFEESVARESGPLGYKLGAEFQGIETKLDGLQQGMYLLGGTPNTGKTSFLVNIARFLVESNLNIHVVFFSQDDHARKIYFRLLAGLSRKPINYVANMGPRIFKNSNLTDKQRVSCFQEVEKAKKRLDEILSRLHIFDSSDCGEIGFIEETSRILKQKYGNLAIVVDGLSKVQVKGFKGDATTKTGELSAKLKGISNKISSPIITTAELRKLNHQGPPCMDDLRDSSQLAYDADVILLAHNPWSASGASSDKYRITRTNINGRMVEFISPILELNFAKNKLSGFRGSIDLALVPDLAIVTELDYMDELEKAEKLFERR